MQEYMKKTLDYYEANAQDYKREWTDDFLANYDFTILIFFCHIYQIKHPYWIWVVAQAEIVNIF